MLVVTVVLVASMAGVPAGAVSAQTDTGDRLLRLGSIGADVEALEQRLDQLGFDPGTIDQRFDTDTHNAVLQLQRAARIDDDGIVGPITRGVLDAGTVTGDTPIPVPTRLLRLGSIGADVEALEQRLDQLGFDPGTIDQRFDTDTHNAVLQLQRAARIDDDGIVGPITRGVLDAGTVTGPAQPTDPPSTPPEPKPAPEPTPEPTPEPEPDPVTDRLLRTGSTGADVEALERRLDELGYWVGTVDQRFDSRTHHAVVALQKVAGIGRDGIVGPVTRSALDAGARPSPRTGAGHLIEIDLTRQVLLVVDGGTVSRIYDTSTGRTPGSTPVGTFSVTREIGGYRYAPLGTLYRPKYFYGGVAIHGYTSVPSWPASHGCVPPDLSGHGRPVGHGGGPGRHHDHGLPLIRGTRPWAQPCGGGHRRRSRPARRPGRSRCRRDR